MHTNSQYRKTKNVTNPTESTEMGPANISPATAASIPNLFLLLSLVFSYPQEQTYEKILNYHHLIQEIFQIYDLQAPVPGQKEELQAEYINLFVNTQSGISLVPYASWYLEPEGQLMGSTVTTLREIIQDHDYQTRDNNPEPEDHISIILELCSKIFPDATSSKTFSNSKTHADFSWMTSNCLGPMLQKMQGKMANLACSEFYPKFILLCRNVVEDVRTLFDFSYIEKNIPKN